MTGRFVAPSGRQIFFEEAGAGRPVLALHGVGGGAYFFRGLAERLDLQYRIVAIDLPGTGRSVPLDSSAALDAASLSMDGWVSDLGAFVDLKVGAPAIVIGHSLGTILALKCWEAWPASIAGFVFVGGLAEARPLIRDRLSARLLTVAEQGVAELGPVVSPANFSPASLQNRPEVVGLFERAFEQQVPAAYSRSIEILLETSATSIVPTVTVPVCSISGADDQYAPPEAIHAFLAALPSLPEPVVVMPDVGHLPFFEAPESIAREVGAFLSRI